METLSAVINNALFISILVIIFSSLVAFYASTRSRDRCLHDFDRYLITVKDQKGEVAWGTLRASPSLGLALSKMNRYVIMSKNLHWGSGPGVSGGRFCFRLQVRCSGGKGANEP